MKISKTYIASFLFAAVMLANVPLMAQQLKGNGNFKSQTRNVSDFKGINTSGGFYVEITQGDTESLKIEAEENLIDNIKTEVRNGVLHIYSDKSISTSEGMKAYITVKELNEIDISGGVQVVGKSAFKTNILKLDMSGASTVNMALNANKIIANMSGASKIELKGQVNDLKIAMSGASHAAVAELIAKDVNVTASGASKAKVHADKALHITASGASAVFYKGSPSISSDASAAARISRL